MELTSKDVAIIEGDLILPNSALESIGIEKTTHNLRETGYTYIMEFHRKTPSFIILSAIIHNPEHNFSSHNYIEDQYEQQFHGFILTFHAIFITQTINRVKFNNLGFGPSRTFYAIKSIMRLSQLPKHNNINFMICPLYFPKTLNLNYQYAPKKIPQWIAVRRRREYS